MSASAHKNDLFENKCMKQEIWSNFWGGDILAGEK